MTKLYIIEGLPCSGKSTLAGIIADALRKSGRSVIEVDEGATEHPADYAFHAFLTESELKKLPADARREAKGCAEKASGGYVVPLSKISDDNFYDIIDYKIYDMLPWEREMPVMLDKWRAFAQKAAREDSVYVFNCVLLQNPMSETMMRFGFDAEVSRAYIAEIADIIAPLETKVIYLNNAEVRKRVEVVSKQREGWLDSAIDYHINSAYGESTGAKGLKGYIACLTARRDRELEILKALPLESIVIDNSDGKLEQAKKEALAFIAGEA